MNKSESKSDCKDECVGVNAHVACACVCMNLSGCVNASASASASTRASVSVTEVACHKRVVFLLNQLKYYWLSEPSESIMQHLKRYAVLAETPI